MRGFFLPGSWFPAGLLFSFFNGLPPVKFGMGKAGSPMEGADLSCHAGSTWHQQCKNGTCGMQMPGKGMAVWLCAQL